MLTREQFLVLLFMVSGDEQTDDANSQQLKDHDAALRAQLADTRQALHDIGKQYQVRTEELHATLSVLKAKLTALEQDRKVLVDMVNELQTNNAALVEALRNCYAMARRMQGKFQNDECWTHIMRFCEQAGLQPDGILRQQVHATQEKT